MKYLTTP